MFCKPLQRIFSSSGMNFFEIWPTGTPYMRYFDFSLWSTVLCFLFCHIISHRRRVYKFEEEILRCTKLQVKYACHWSNHLIPYQISCTFYFSQRWLSLQPFIVIRQPTDYYFANSRLWGMRLWAGQSSRPSIRSRDTSLPTSRRSPPSRRRRFVR